MAQTSGVTKPDLEDVTFEMWMKIDDITSEYKGRPGSTIPVLRLCQDTVGYLPKPLLGYVADRMGVARSEVFGVATFYALFSMTPKGRHTIRVCEGTACYVRGIKEVMDRIKNQYKIPVGGTTEDRRFSLESVRCLGACGLAPVVVVNHDTYGAVTPEKMDEILTKYE